MILVRTTINPGEPLLNTVRTSAAGPRPEPARPRKRNGFPVMRPQPGARTVTARHVARRMKEMEQVEVQA